MIKKFFFVIFFIIFYNNITNSNEYKILVTVNNIAITRIDLEKEIFILKMLNDNLSNKLNLGEIALRNLIDEKLKLIEIRKNNIQIDEKNIQNYLNTFLEEKKINKNQINKEILYIIKEKINIDTSWNILINKLYGWKININIQEIDNKINESKVNLTNEEIKKFKEKLINTEKNKKLKVFDNYHLNKIKKNSYINYF